jgi:hypothetical protein
MMRKQNMVRFLKNSVNGKRKLTAIGRIVLGDWLPTIIYVCVFVALTNTTGCEQESIQNSQPENVHVRWERTYNRDETHPILEGGNLIVTFGIDSKPDGQYVVIAETLSFETTAKNNWRLVGFDRFPPGGAYTPVDGNFSHGVRIDTNAQLDVSDQYRKKIKSVGEFYYQARWHFVDDEGNFAVVESPDYEFSLHEGSIAIKSQQ